MQINYAFRCVMFYPKLKHTGNRTFNKLIASISNIYNYINSVTFNISISSSKLPFFTHNHHHLTVFTKYSVLYVS